jgi:formylglycine-generating enzyme required for sulfatase activity
VTAVEDRGQEETMEAHQPSPPGPKNMVRIAGGRFGMGSEDFYPEERPVHTVEVGDFWMDTNPVTVAEFRRFVKATGHVTVAETPPDPLQFPDADPEQLVPGSLVFTPPPHPVALDDFRAWWAWVPGADWRHPEGPDSGLHGRERHPVTHVAYVDALAYATWSGKELPREAEWEFAARGGLEGATYAWGEDFSPGGRMMANTWQGDFPVTNDLLDGYERTSPVGKFPANGYGLSDMIGNVWEWTCEDYTESHADVALGRAQRGASGAAHGCCAPQRPAPVSAEVALNPNDGTTKVIKGGSHLCAPNYCLRYRPAARQRQTVDTSTSHMGLRCIIRD